MGQWVLAGILGRMGRRWWQDFVFVIWVSARWNLVGWINRLLVGFFSMIGKYLGEDYSGLWFHWLVFLMDFG